MTTRSVLCTGAALVLLPLSAGLAAAQDTTSYVKTLEGTTVEDVAFDVEQAITEEGLVIDLKSHVGEMLSRTKADVGGTKDLFTEADIFSFCSSTVSRQVMEADPANVQHCPYTIFVYEMADKPGSVVVGHRLYPGESMQPVNELLTKLVDKAVE